MLPWIWYCFLPNELFRISYCDPPPLLELLRILGLALARALNLVFLLFVGFFFFFIDDDNRFFSYWAPWSESMFCWSNYIYWWVVGLFFWLREWCWCIDCWPAGTPPEFLDLSDPILTKRLSFSKWPCIYGKNFFGLCFSGGSTFCSFVTSIIADYSLPLFFLVVI